MQYVNLPQLKIYINEKNKHSLFNAFDYLVQARNENRIFPY